MALAVDSKYIITKDSYEEFTNKLAFAVNKAINYNKECFGMSDLRLACAMEHILGRFIEKVIEAGYCPHALLGNALDKNGFYVNENSKRPNLKQYADEDMLIDIFEFEPRLGYIEHCATLM